MADEQVNQPEHEQPQEEAAIDPNDLDARLDAVLQRIASNEPELYDAAMEPQSEAATNAAQTQEESAEQDTSESVAATTTTTTDVEGSETAEPVSDELKKTDALSDELEVSSDDVPQEEATPITVPSDQSLVEEDLARLEAAVDEVAESVENAEQSIENLDEAIGAQLDALIEQQINTQSPEEEGINIKEKFAAKAAEAQHRAGADFGNIKQSTTSESLNETQSVAETQQGTEAGSEIQQESFDLGSQLDALLNSSMSSSPAAPSTTENETPPLETPPPSVEAEPPLAAIDEELAAPDDPSLAIEQPATTTDEAAPVTDEAASTIESQSPATQDTSPDQGLDDGDLENQLASLLQQSAPTPSAEEKPEEPTVDQAAVQTETETTAGLTTAESDATAALDAALDEMLDTQPSTESDDPPMDETDAETTDNDLATVEADETINETSDSSPEELTQLDAMLAGEADKEIEQELTPPDALEANKQADVIEGKTEPEEIDQTLDEVAETPADEDEAEDTPADTAAELDAALDAATNTVDVAGEEHEEITAKSDDDEVDENDADIHDEAEEHDNEPVLAGSLKERLIAMAKDLPQQMFTVDAARRVCTVINKPALGMKRETRNLIGYIGLVTLFNATALLLYNLFH